MDMSIVWKSLVLILAGSFLLRLSGRKAISQMTISESIVMISLGTIIVQPIAQEGVMLTILAAALFVLFPLLFEYLQVKFNFVEKLITGKSIVIIENGALNVKNLKKVRLTVDQLEMRMREKGISKIEDIKTATIEPNGLLGYELKDDSKPLTAGEFKKLLNEYGFAIQEKDHSPAVYSANPNVFEEVKHPGEQGHPKYLQ